MNMYVLMTASWPLPVALAIWFAETTLLAMPLAAAAWLGSRSRRLGPSARHVLWLMVLIRLIMPPIIHWPWAQVPGIPAAASPVHFDEDLPRPPSPVAASESASAPDEADWADPIVTAPEPGPPTFPAGLDEASALENHEPATPSHFPDEATPDIWNMGSAAMCVSLAWLFGSLVVTAMQAKRIFAFRRRLRPGLAAPAPDWLVEETASIAELLRVRPPSVWIVPGLSTPMLWCLGRPRLLIPRHLLAELDTSRWRGILAHELAHLRRRDHWVSRLELAVGLVWWWNPIYRLVRRRIDSEAELACDAWVVSLLPEDRLTYADSLFQLSSKLSHRSSTAMHAPALGVTGSGQFFEKRLTMILRDTVSYRPSAWNALAAALLMLVSVPSWTLAVPPETTSLELIDKESASITDSDESETIEADSETPAPPVPPVAPIAPLAPIPPVPPVPPVTPTALTIKGPGGQTLNAGNRPSAKTIRTKEKPEMFRDDVNEEVRQEKAAAEFEAKMEAFAEKMEAFAEDVVEKTMGPEFEKRMEAIGKDMEKKYGPGSDFEKVMKSMAKDMEKQFGPGSDFEKAIKRQAEEFKADASRIVQGAKADAKTVRGNKKLSEKMASEAKRHAAQDRFTTDKPDETNDRGLKPTEKTKNLTRAEADEDENVAPAKRDRARAESEQAKVREARERAEANRKLAQAKAAEQRAASKGRERERRIKLLEQRLQKLMDELKQLETEDRQPVR